MFWLINALKAGKIKSVGQAIRAFTNVNGRAPSGVERLRIGQIFENTKAKVLPFKYKKSFKQEIDEMSKPAPTVGGKTIEEALGGISWADKKKKAKRIKQGLSTKIKLNTLGENKQLAKELVSGKNSEFNTLDKAAKREVLDRLEINIKNTKADFATPVKPEDLASGGRIGFGGGGAAWKFFMKFFEPSAIKTSNDIRHGLGKWARLTDKQKGVQHDNFTKIVDDIIKTKKYNKKADEYIGFDVKKAFKEKTDQYVTPLGKKEQYLEDLDKRIMDEMDLTKSEMDNMSSGALDDLRRNADPIGMEKDFGEITTGRGVGDFPDDPFKAPFKTEPNVKPKLVSDEVLAKAYDEVFYQKPASGDYKYDADVLADSIAEQLGKGSLDDFSQAQQFEIHDTALKRIYADLKMKRTLKQVEQKMKLSDFDVKGRKPNQSGGLAYMLGEPTYSDGGRIGFKGGTKFDPTKRKFLKGAGAGLGVLSMLPFVGKFFKPAAKAAKALTKVPITQTADMPQWFVPLVNKVIKQGDDVTKQYATVEREIVHATKLPESGTDVLVTQNLDSGDVLVDIGISKHGFEDGHLGQPARLIYKASEEVPYKTYPGGKVRRGSTKTKEEFWVDEAEFTGGHPENIKFEESISEKFGEHGSNFDEVEKFATGTVKKKTGKESIKAERAHWTPEGDYASGGRVPFIAGGDAEDYGELIDAYEAGIDVMPGETLTDYINRIRKAEKRRKNKASGGLAYMLGE